MLFSYEDTTTLKTLGKLACDADRSGNKTAYANAHQVLEDFIEKLHTKYPERFKGE